MGFQLEIVLRLFLAPRECFHILIQGVVYICVSVCVRKMYLNVLM